MKQNQVGLIVLAAGASERLGQPKQLLYYKGKTLLRHIAEESLASSCRPVVVVLGFETNRLKEELNGLELEITENSLWKEGMGSSVRAGLKRLLEVNEPAAGVVLTVCDQPFVTSRVIDRLADVFHETTAPVVASAYRETIGVPALFSRELFPQLAGLEGNEGAKSLIQKFRKRVVSLPFPAGETDIDTAEDLELLSRI